MITIRLASMQKNVQISFGSVMNCKWCYRLFFILAERLNTTDEESDGETIAGSEEECVDSSASEGEPMEGVSDNDYDKEEDMESEEEVSEFIARFSIIIVDLKLFFLF